MCEGEYLQLSLLTTFTTGQSLVLVLRDTVTTALLQGGDCSLNGIAVPLPKIYCRLWGRRPEELAKPYTQH